MIMLPNTGYLEKKRPRKKYPGNVGRSMVTNVEHSGLMALDKICSV